MAKHKIRKPEICFECNYFRERTADGSFVCINKHSARCDGRGIQKATQACRHSELNPKLIEKYPERYEL